MEIVIDGVAYVPKKTVLEAPKGVRYILAVGVTDLQREHAKISELYKHGDMKLVWVNEGDLYAFWSEN